MRRLLTYALLLCATLAVGAQEKVVFEPHWSAQAQFVGYYVAKEKGFYSQEGLDVEIRHPSVSRSSFYDLWMGNCDLTTTFLTAAMKHFTDPDKMINVMQTSQGCAQLIVMREPVSGPSDLKGKKIGYWAGGDFNTVAEIVDKELGLDIQWIKCNWNIGLYKTGAVDGLVCQDYNELFQFRAAGIDISKDQIIYLADLGFNIPEDGVYCLEKYCKSKPEAVRKFVAASRKGWEYAYNNRDEALQIVMKYVKEDNVITNSVAQKWMLNHVLDNAFDGDFDMKLSRATLDKTSLILKNHNYIPSAIPFDVFVFE